MPKGNAQVKMACLFAQVFAHLIRNKVAYALEPWLEDSENLGVPEFRKFAGGIRSDLASTFAALTSSWSQGAGRRQVHRLKLLKRQGLLRYRILAGLHELSTEDDGDSEFVAIRTETYTLGY